MYNHVHILHALTLHLEYTFENAVGVLAHHCRGLAQRCPNLFHQGLNA